MSHGYLNMLDVQLRVPVHNELSVLVVSRQALDHDALECYVWNGLSHVLHWVAKAGGSDEMFVRILSGLRSRGHKFRRHVSNGIIYGCHIPGVQLHPCLLRTTVGSCRPLPVLANKVLCWFRPLPRTKWRTINGHLDRKRPGFGGGESLPWTSPWLA